MQIKNRRILSLLLALFMTLSLSIAFAAEGDPVEKSPLQLTVFHVNDSHSRIGESSTDYAKIAGQVDALRSQGQNVLLFDAGDTLHGKPIANLYEGYSIVEIMNTMGFDAMVPGNHDFNYGYQRLAALSKMTNFPMLSSNVSSMNKPLVGPDPNYLIKEFDGYKIGIFGLTTQETKYKSHPDNVRGIQFADPIETSKAMVKALKAEKCDYIIAVGHIGVDGGTIIKSTDICAAVPEIDLFIDGHSHTTLFNGLQTDNGIVVSTGEHLNRVGVVNIKVTADEKITRVDLLDQDDTAAWPVKASTNQIIEKYKTEVSIKNQETIGKTDVDLIGEREVVRTGESNLGNLIVDAVRVMSKADIALSNGGNVRATIPAGDITYGQILEVLPFGNTVVLKQITGADIIAALEQGVSEYPAASGGFLHISGGTYTFDPAQPVGKRIVSVTINGEPIEKSKTYILATNDFLAAGGDLSPLGNGSIYGELGAMDDLVLNYIKTYSAAVDADTTPRITALGK